VAETILIVDDEELVRRTFREWLQGADPDCELVEAWDAESALQIASQRSIDLAILDWNLGAGNNGLQLLEDLRVFCPEVVAILVTGYAHQATPLDALRMGVRDYLDKNRDLRRETLLAVVRRQLEQIRPAKRERQHLERVRQFQQALEAIVPLVQTTSDLSSGIAPSESLRALLQFAQDIFQTRHGVLLVRNSKMEASNASSDSSAVRAQSNSDRAHVPDFSVDLLDMEGRRLETANVPFAETLAATALAMQEVSVLANLKEMVPPGGHVATLRTGPRECGGSPRASGATASRGAGSFRYSAGPT
jgi:two-component system nitrogen regulation response regulator NtrX